MWVCDNEHVSKRRYMKWKDIDSQRKKKLHVQRSVKKVMLTLLSEMKGPISTDFHERDETVNYVSYCKTLRLNSPYLFNDPCIIQKFCICLKYINVFHKFLFVYINNVWSEFSIKVIVVQNGIDDPSSNSGRCCLRFRLRWCSCQWHELICSPPPYTPT